MPNITGIADSGDPIQSAGGDIQQSPGGDLDSGPASSGNFSFTLDIVDSYNGPSFVSDSRGIRGNVVTLTPPLNAILQLDGIGPITNPPNNPPSFVGQLGNALYYGTNIAGGYWLYGGTALVAQGILNVSVFQPGSGEIQFNGVIACVEPLDVAVYCGVFMRPGTWQIGIQQSVFDGNSSNSGTVYVGKQLIANLGANGISQGSNPNTFSSVITVVVPPGGAFLTLQMSQFQSEGFSTLDQNGQYWIPYPDIPEPPSATIAITATFIHV